MSLFCSFAFSLSLLAQICARFTPQHGVKRSIFYTANKLKTSQTCHQLFILPELVSIPNLWSLDRTNVYPLDIFITPHLHWMAVVNFSPANEVLKSNSIKQALIFSLTISCQFYFYTRFSFPPFCPSEKATVLVYLYILEYVGGPDGGCLPQKSLDGNCVQPSGPVLLAFHSPPPPRGFFCTDEAKVPLDQTMTRMFFCCQVCLRRLA